MAIILAMAMVLPTTDTTDMPILMPMDTTMARGPLMPRLPPLLRPSPRLRLMPMLTMVSTDMAFPMPDMDTVLPTMDTAMPTTDTTDMPILMPMDTTTARGLLMLRLPPLLRPMLMLTTDTTDMPVLMPTDTTEMPMDS